MLKPRRVQLLLLCSGLRFNQLVQRLLIVSPHGAGSGGRACQVRRHKYSCLTLENTFKCYELENGPPMDVELSREDAITMYTQMVEMRRVEVLADAEYKKRTIRGFCHLYNGQEAVAIGMMQRLRKCDSVITAYRCHAWTYLMGVSLHDMMAELLGFKTGCSRGKGGSMHMYSDKFYGGNGIVGAQVPLGAGVALAHQYRRDGGVCVALYGDGAANQGQIFEAYNMAKLWCLPCIFVCENNHYGMGTRVDRASAMTEFYKRGQYVPGLWVDGNQVLAVRSATQFAVDYAVEHGPIVLEMCTYRYVGHSMSDPGISYRSREEVNKVRETRDPIISFRNQMIQLCLATEEEIKKLDGEIRKRVDAECKKALGGKEVPLEELYADVYSKNLEPKIRGVSGYVYNHFNIADVCFGKPRKTPANEICDVPVGDAALLAKAAEDKKKKEAQKKAKDGDKKDKDGGAAKKGNTDSKSDAKAKAGGAAKAEKKQPDKPAGKEGPTPSPSSPPPPASGGKPPAVKK